MMTNILQLVTEWRKKIDPEYRNEEALRELRNDKIMAEKSDLVDEVPEPLKSDY